MTKYRLFSEHNDLGIWGESLADAILRRKDIPTKPTVIDGKLTPSPSLKISKVLGMRNTENSTRGQWKYISAVCETESGQIVEIDAREVDKL